MKHLLIMSLVLITSVTIGANRFDSIHSAEIESSWRNLGNTAEIKLPSYNKTLQKAIQKGDAVTISMGYKNKGGLRTEFTGFVSRVERSIPVSIQCEDYSYFLKRTNIAKAFKGDTTLKVIVNHILDIVNTSHVVNIGLDEAFLPDISLHNHRIDNKNAAMALEDLKEYGLAIYLEGETLFIHLPYARNLPCLLYTSPSPRDGATSRMPSSA